VAEQAIGMLLSVLNNIVPAFHQIKNGIWQREANRGIELMGKTIGIIGYGNVGSALAKRLSSFGVQVFAYDKYKFGFSDDFAKEKSIDEIFRYADILSLHIPLTQETEYLINDDFLKKFKKKIFLINTSRGKIVKTSDLVGNLKTGKVSGACLDVLEYEKITFEELYNSENQEELKYLTSVENVILSPHIAGLTHESNYKLSEILADKIIEYCKKDKFCV
jgi:D-3-phosphoglycerate dehydrogenase